MKNNEINWESEIDLPCKGIDIEYAYMEKGSDEVVECSKEELIKLLKSKKSKYDTLLLPAFFSRQRRLIIR